MPPGDTPAVIDFLPDRLRRRSLLLLLLALLLLTSLACRLGSPAEPTRAPQRLVFQDDFSTPGERWSRIVARQGLADYGDGVYRIRVDQPDLDVWVKAGVDLKDTRVEVYALKASPPRNDRFGLLCRITPEGNFYAFLITSDGYFGIGKQIGGEFALIGAEALRPLPAIHPGTAYNHLRADCVGSGLTFWINDELAARVEDTDLAVGDVGLLAGAYETGGVEIYFDNFIVYRP